MLPDVSVSSITISLPGYESARILSIESGCGFGVAVGMAVAVDVALGDGVIEGKGVKEGLAVVLGVGLLSLKEQADSKKTTTNKRNTYLALITRSNHKSQFTGNKNPNQIQTHSVGFSILAR